MDQTRKDFRKGLVEGYKDFQSLKRVALSICFYISENTMFDFMHRGIIPAIKLSDVINRMNHEGIEDLAKSDLKVVIDDDREGESKVRGQYFHGQSIWIYAKGQLRTLRSTLSRIVDPGDAEDYYREWLRKNCISTILHELQHAWDDIRSKGHALKQRAPNVGTDAERYVKYLQLPHEMWARFVQTAEKTKFIEEDMDGVLSMVPLESTLKDFATNYNGWKDMFLDQKRRLMRKVSQFWHFEQDKVNEFNNGIFGQAAARSKQRRLNKAA